MEGDCNPHYGTDGADTVTDSSDSTSDARTDHCDRITDIGALNIDSNLVAHDALTNKSTDLGADDRSNLGADGGTVNISSNYFAYDGANFGAHNNFGTRTANIVSDDVSSECRAKCRADAATRVRDCRVVSCRVERACVRRDCEAAAFRGGSLVRFTDHSNCG